MASGPKFSAALFKNLDDPETGKLSPVAILTWVLLCIVLYAYLFSLPLHRLFDSIYFDESHWIWVSQRYFGYVLKGDFKNPDWDQHYSYFGRYNPKIAQYLIGAPLYFSGELTTKFKPARWKQGRNADWKDRLDDDTPVRTLFYGRLIMPFLGAGCGLLFLFISSRVLHWLPSLVATLLLGANHLMVEYSARAMLDMPALFFGLVFLAVLFAFNWRTTLEKSLPRALLWALAAGFGLGLAISTKLNNLVLIGVWMGYLAWITMIEAGPGVSLKLRNAGKYILLCSAGLLMALVIFVGSNPYLYSRSPTESFAKAGVLFKLSDKANDDQKAFPQYRINSPAEKFKIIGKYAFSNYSRKSLEHPLLGYLLAFAGGLFIFYRLVQEFRSGSIIQTDRLVLLIIMLATIGLGNFLWIPINFSRYFIPLLVLAMILIGFAVELMVRGLAKAGVRFHPVAGGLQ